jgi:A/G-specific adenine glycosylase
MRRKASSTVTVPPPASVRAASSIRLSGPAIRRKLFSWYDANKRDLPWRRRQNDPYAQWVAEIMLQQTRVETVLRYYEPFLARFPTVAALARADRQSVLKMWEGLGYYRRVLHLHQAAGDLCNRGSDIPRTSEGLRTLRGIGDYTAAAIASIAFGEPVAAVDGNVARILARLLGLPDTSTTSSRNRIRIEAGKLLCRQRPGDFNQAWMDLGSRICRPRSPKCPECPLQNHCRTGRHGGALPASRPAARVEACTVLVGLMMHKNRLLVTRRPEGGLWSGLWEFPSLTCDTAVVLSSFKKLAATHDLVVPGKPRKLGLVRHDLSHRRIRFHVYETELEAVGASAQSARWVTQKAFERLPVSTAHRRIHRLWLDRGAGNGAR